MADWTVVEGGGYAYTLWGIRGASPDEMWKVWDSVGPDLINGMMGVWTCAGEEVFVSGMRGGMASGGADDWLPIYGVTNFDLHGVWGDCDGNVLMGGGELFTTKPPPAGVIVGRGEFAAGPPRAWEE